MLDRETWKTWEGRVVAGKFPLRRWLGGSDHSAVFLTVRGNPAAAAAIKLTAPADPDAEIALLKRTSQLSHPNLISIFDCGSEPSPDAPVIYAVMELADDDLSRILPERALSASEVGEMLPGVLDGLTYLHAKGLVQGHLTPANVLAVGEQLKLSTDQIRPFTESGQRPRRDAYDAPEISSGSISAASDLWSLGATLVTALTQNPPVLDESSERDPVVPKSMPEPFRGIARECLHVDPKRRCSIADIRARLETSSRSVPAEPETPTLEPASPYRSLRRMLIPFAVLLAAVIGFLALHHGSKPSSIQTFSAAQPPEPTATPQAASTPPPAGSSPGSVVHKVLPDLPAQARHTISGTIRIAVRVDVDASGAVTTAVLADSGPSAYFASRTLKAAEQWEFAAPRANSQPIPSTWLLHFRIKRNSIQAEAKRSQ